ncbi:hypothetical protein KIN20_024675 [Parelaphostrongylus tenuis]|uniref:SAM-dependent MTase TRM10-type domain-containing protein n=1 Tax=Parelaphostrongylus tenuis TaxID=148309 RepID=A0AAD5MXA4_PARTN|nr:hypothetical protein KIN20_024675 [Parelaphostrongylus tenuis]
MLRPVLFRLLSRHLPKFDAFESAAFASKTTLRLQLHTVEDSSRSSSRAVGVFEDEEEPEGYEGVDYEEQLKALMPSEEVYKAIPSAHHEKIKEMIKELEIYTYMSNFVPKSLSDADWLRILNSTDTVSERVSFLEYVAEIKAKLDSEREKFERGEMGYGPDLYQLIHNPFRNRKKIHLIQGARMVTALRCDETPKIAFDLQYMFKEKQRVLSELGNQMQYVISENLDSRTPFPLSFVNFENSDISQEWLRKCVGFYGGQYTHQTVLPDFTEKGIREIYPDEEVVYISRHARDVIDGPFKVGAIALCVSRDIAREALGAARRSRIRAVRLPIKKYVKWQQGPMYLPFPNIMRVFREVHLSGGDWETALLNNISKRHLTPPEEQESEKLLEKRNRRKARLRERSELVRTIQEATGHS